jgi:hypothetical protein
MTPPRMTDWPIERWLSDAEYVLDGDFAKMERYLEATELPRDLKACADVLRNEFGRSLAGVGVDLAAGNLWAVPPQIVIGR